jgi:hypothetical protein
MMPYPVLDLDPNASAFICVAHVSVIDLDGIDRLDEIRLFTLDMDHVAQMDLAISQFNDPDVYSRIIVNDTSNKRFSYADGHGQSPIFNRPQDPGGYTLQNA